MSDLDQRLKDMPKFDISSQQKQEMHRSIMAYYDKRVKRSTRSNRLKKLSVVLGSLAALALLFIIITASLNQKVENRAVDAIKAPQNSQTSSVQENSGSTAQSQPDPILKTSLTLPNGKIVTQSAQWKGLTIQLNVSSISPDEAADPEMFKGVIGNHSTIISHEIVPTSAGEAILALNKRTKPAAAQSSEAAYEYWVIVHGSQYAYSIEVSFFGNPSIEKHQVEHLLGQWKVPKEGLK
ncbi:hypothetical protein E4665_08440 [Sporolactobacillus shoreae]|uniref:DUF4367 domain-containing protein n=1 Tax=Sporolactobacillus shoreae TaxID=1465501 RepID=A0A4Z0GQA0_9BACL|nr:hypothetical protein [Sporolactobacillus shoreae]TGA98267.1 hypothetical protein E4665_08440 [Sporolactobacillus shoreae]